MNRINNHDERRRAGWLAAHPLLAGLLLLTVLAPCPLCAQTNAAKAALSSQRWLLIVETSRPMKRRAGAVLQAVRDLLASSMDGQLQRGDTLGVWTFNEGLYAGRFPLQTWSPKAQQDITSRMLTFLKGQKYEKQANFSKGLPALNQIIKDSDALTVVLISSGDETMRGTPFDAQINEFFQKWHDQQQKAKMPFVTVLRAKAGQLADYTLNSPPFPTQMPRPSQVTQSAEPIQTKLSEAVRKSPPPTVPPLIVSGKKAQPEKAPAPKLEPTVVKTNAPAPAAAAPGTNNLLAAKPPAPTVPPVETAKPEAAPVTSTKPPTEVASKSSPAPVPVTESKAEAVKGPEAKPVEPTPAKPEVAPPVQTPAPKPQPVAIEPPKPAPEPKPALAPTPVLAPPATQGVSPSALAHRPSVLASPPSSSPRPSAQTGTALPGETLARHTNIWIAGLVLAGVAAAFAILLLRRSRTAPQASLITQSFERKHKP